MMIILRKGEEVGLKKEFQKKLILIVFWKKIKSLIQITLVSLPKKMKLILTVCLITMTIIKIMKRLLVKILKLKI